MTYGSDCNLAWCRLDSYGLENIKKALTVVDVPRQKLGLRMYEGAWAYYKQEN